MCPKNASLKHKNQLHTDIEIWSPKNPPKSGIFQFQFKLKTLFPAFSLDHIISCLSVQSRLFCRSVCKVQNEPLGERNHDSQCQQMHHHDLELELSPSICSSQSQEWPFILSECAKKKYALVSRQYYISSVEKFFSRTLTNRYCYENVYYKVL